MGQHAEFHYSVAVRTDDLAVLHCLRSLSQYAQKTGNKRIPWGGTKESDWRDRNHWVIFHFTSPSYRRGFLAEVARLLAHDLWEKGEERDDDPAKPQKSSW